MKLVLIYHPKKAYGIGHIAMQIYPDDPNQAVLVCSRYSESPFAENNGYIVPIRAIDFLNYAEAEREKEYYSTKPDECECIEIESVSGTYEQIKNWATVENKEFSYALLDSNCAVTVKKALDQCGIQLNTNTNYHYFKNFLATVSCIVSCKGWVCFPCCFCALYVI